MKILVTGSEGSLMQAVIPLLLDAGHAVTGVDNFARHGLIDRNRTYSFETGDLTDPDVVSRLATGSDGIIQAAATIYGVGGFHRYPASILGNDLILHANVLRGAVAAGVKRVVYISSSMVYERAETVPTAEDDVERFGIPLTDYGLSKLVGERMSRAFQAEHGLDYTIWRPFNIITPFERGEREIGTSHVFADFAEALLVRKQLPLPILGDGEQVRCFTWIGDVAQGIADHSFSSSSRNEVFNLGNPRPTTMRELAEMMFDQARSRGLYSLSDALHFEHLPAYQDDVRTRVPDVQKAARVLGWQPTIPLEDALDRCIDAILSETAVS